MTLHGPPGCGKTSIIVSIARENGIEVVEIVLSEILSMWSGESEKRLTQAFETAKEIARSGRPVIVFIDELDSLGIARSVTLESGEGSWSRDLRNTFRRLLNEVRDIPNLAIVGATNYLWSVDVALKRPGRMGASIIYVPPPDTKTREEIFRLYSEETPGHESLDYKKLAEMTQWFSGDDIQNVCREVYNAVARRIIMKEQEKAVASMKDYKRFINERIPTCLSWIQDVARAWIEGRIRNNEVDKRLLVDIELACPNAANEKEKAKKTSEEDKRRRPEYVM
jgi:SpoVK/Ycf46/Vps4 family AAA+-type ATPase